MTAQTATYNQPIPQFSRLLILAAVLLAAVMSGVLLGDHALKHREAEWVRKCIEKNGPAEVWEHLEAPQKEYWLCQLDNGKWAWMIVQKWNSIVQACKYKECTSYIPKGGDYQKIVDYLSQIARRVS